MTLPRSCQWQGFGIIQVILIDPGRFIVYNFDSNAVIGSVTAFVPNARAKKAKKDADCQVRDEEERKRREAEAERKRLRKAEEEEKERVRKEEKQRKSGRVVHVKGKNGYKRKKPSELQNRKPARRRNDRRRRKRRETRKKGSVRERSG